MTLAERKKDTMTMSDGGFVVAVLIANELNFDWCSFCAIYLANPNVCDST